MEKLPSFADRFVSKTQFGARQQRAKFHEQSTGPRFEESQNSSSCPEASSEEEESERRRGGECGATSIKFNLKLIIVSLLKVFLGL